MRELKFRAFDKIQKKYVFTGFNVIGEVTAFKGIETEIMETKELRGGRTILECLDDFIIEQFTGLKDCNGIDIYEGDKIKFTHHGRYLIDSFEAVVIYVKRYACFAFEYTTAEGIYRTFFPTSCDEIEIDILPYIEVIGNIFEDNNK
jgi:uncharacterized phage protein (TIGR01671 family)